jgi:hypothetical protein
MYKNIIMNKINVMVNIRDFDTCNHGGFNLPRQCMIYDVDPNKPFSHIVDRYFAEHIDKFMIPNMYIDKELIKNFSIRTPDGRNNQYTDKIKSCFNPDVTVIEPIPILWLDLWTIKKSMCVKFQDNENKIIYFPSLATKNVKAIKTQLRKLGYNIKELYCDNNIVEDHKIISELNKYDLIFKSSK